MAPKVWQEIRLPNQIIQIISLEKDRIPDAVTVMRNAFFPLENIALGVELTSNQAAIDEVGKLCAAIAEDGFSMMAVVKETNQAIGVILNKLHTKRKTGEPSFLENFIKKHCKEEQAISFSNCMNDLITSVNLFEKFKTNCFMEIVFLGVLPQWGKKGVGQGLGECSLEFFKSMQSNSKYEYIPNLVASVITSKFSYKIVKQLNFQDINRREFSEYVFRGWKYSDKVDCNVHDQGLVLVAKQI